MTKQISVTAPTAGDGECFIGNKEMLKRLPVSLGTLGNWRRAGLLPYVQLTKRRVLYHWPSVEQALVRMQRGGAL